MPLALEIGHLLRSTLTRSEARTRLGLPVHGSLVGIVGRLVAVKDVDCFLDAAARLAHVRDDATFVVAGDGELRASLEARGRELLGPRVRFLGWVGDLAALYAALDVVVLTSLNEGTPVALIEAGAAARPVVATRVGGVPSVVTNGVTGTLVPPRQPQGVATQVLQLLEHTDLARSFGEAGRRQMAERFDSPEPASFVADLYRRLLEAKRGRA
jgi:glycosyltransferase involved in cell wall biosynthesis